MAAAQQRNLRPGPGARKSCGISAGAAELAVSEDRDKFALGIEELGALRDYSELLSRTEAGFIAAALRVATQGPREAIGESGGDYKIVRDTDTDAIEGGDVSSEEGEEPEDGGCLK
jgi:hypothetical protein